MGPANYNGCPQSTMPVCSIIFLCRHRVRRHVESTALTVVGLRYVCSVRTSASAHGGQKRGQTTLEFTGTCVLSHMGAGIQTWGLCKECS